MHYKTFYADTQIDRPTRISNTGAYMIRASGLHGGTQEPVLIDKKLHKTYALTSVFDVSARVSLLNAIDDFATKSLAGRDSPCAGTQFKNYYRAGGIAERPLHIGGFAFRTEKILRC
jgi:hypothetical protein